MANRIKGITVEINGDTTKLSKALESVNRTIKSTQSQLKDVEKLLKLDPKNTELVAQKQRLLSKAVSDTSEKLAVLKNASAQAQKQLERGEISQQQFDALQREIIETSSQLDSYNRSLNETARAAENASDSMRTMERSTDSAGRKAAESDGHFSRISLVLGKSMVSAAKAAAKAFEAYVASAATLSAAIGGMSLKTYADFEGQMSTVKALMSGSCKTTAELEQATVQLTKKAQELGSTTAYTSVEVGQAMEYMAMAGWQTNDILTSVSGVMDLAAASGEDLATVSDIVTDSMTAFGLSASGEFAEGISNASHYADILAAAATSANTNVSLMGETFKYVAPLAGTLGYSAEDTAIAVGLMANAGIKGSQAGTSLKTALANMAAPTKNQAAAMEQLGISLSAANGDAYSLMDVMQQLRSAIGGTNVEVTDADGNLRDYDDILADISETTDGLSKVQQIQAASTIFGKESMAGLLSIVNASDEDFAKLTTSIYKCNGAAEKMAKIKLDNLKGDLTLLSSAAEGAKIALGKELASAARAAVQGVTEIVNAFNSGGLEGALSKVTELVGQLSNEIKTKLPKILPGLMSSFNSILMTLFKSIGELLPSFIGTILPILISSFADLLSQLAEYILSALPNILESVLSAFMQIADSLKALAPKILTAVKGLLDKLTAFISDSAPEIISTAIEVISGLAKGILKALPKIIKSAIALLRGFIDGLIKNIPMIVNAAMDIVQALCDGLINNLPEIIKAALDLILQLVNGLIQNLPLIVQAAVKMVTSLVQGLISQLPQIIQAAMDFIVSFVNGLINNLPLIIQSAIDLVVGLVTGLLQAIPLIVEALPEIVGAIVDGLFSIDWLELGASILQAVWDGIMSLVDGLLSAWWDVFTSLCDTVADWAVSIWDAATEAISDFCSAVIDGICELPGDVWDWLCDVVDGVIDWGADMIDSAVSAMGDMVDGIIDAVCELPDKMLEIGEDIVEGIWEGISGAAGWLFEQIGDFCSSIWEGVKDFFGINSPSKLFKEELGFNLVYGLADGIDKKVNTAVKAVNSMGIDVMTAAKKSLDANWSITGFDSVPTGNTVINNYYTNDNSRTVNQTNNSPKSLSRLEIYRMTRNALGV